ncbi:hypothetical protein D0A34_08975 [Microcoleus vaginatus PCC 9802]|uniref:hypothetical protein n=1 Tax=Microcoleus vaginatus TaxID=119532 RepID=UPI00020D1CFA|nr:hypothetical protein MicvaDRAFT_3554 [Microcoleus vaginatus FGP-2]UNU18981.1 hypothetical protein D0A34_08975 [Microcoleus vaginatus PCC 9802]
MNRLKQGLSFLFVTLTVAIFTLLSWVLESGELSMSALEPSLLRSSESASVQRVAQQSASPQVRVQDAWKLVYEKLPDFPIENNYISQETGKVDPTNTLVGRLIRYHVFVKGRPPNYRFDWKLSLADYLGATPDYLVESVYPGKDVLRSNPMEQDRAAIQRLNRAQRDALVQALVDVFTENSGGGRTPAGEKPQGRSNSPEIPQPQPGDAKLLAP